MVSSSPTFHSPFILSISSVQKQVKENQMLILKLIDTTLDMTVRNTLLDIRQLAQQIVCYYDDMDHAQGRTALLKLPIPLLPQSALDLNNLLHEKMKAFMFEWAERRNFSINRPILQGPQILSLQNGGISVEDHTISICTVIPRPKRRELVNAASASDNASSSSALLRGELPAKGAIRSPIAESQFVTSLFECEVGNIVILEEGETILVRDIEKADKVGRDICMLTALHCTNDHRERAEQ